MHPINLNLAPPVAANISRDDEQNWADIQSLLAACQHPLTHSHTHSPTPSLNVKDNVGDVVPPQLLGRVLRLIESRMSLKYSLTVTILSTIVDSLLSIYTTKKISIPMKIKSLKVMTSIFKYRKNSLTLFFSYDYHFFWDEMLAICTRNAKDLSCGSESLNSKLFQSLIEFLHEARYYTTQDQAEDMVVNAMNLLSDLRSSNNMFGLQMLVLCLPTGYNNYDAWVPVWLEKLASITHNDGWDACWLTLLCRARKYSTDPFKWTQAALPQLLSKAAELLDPL
jgi:hypothetical protein